MADTKRITAADQADAYRKTGMGITREQYFSDDLACACGMGVYAIARLGASVSFSAISDALDKAGFTIEYQNGFTCGFDGDSRSEYDSDPDYHLGYEDGFAAYAVAKEAARG